MTKYLAVKDYFDYQHGSLITRDKLNDLIAFNYISTVKSNGVHCITTDELSEASGIEYRLKKNYTKFSAFFKDYIGKNSDYSDEDFYNKVIKKTHLSSEIILYNYLGEHYIHNEDKKLIKRNFLSLKMMVKFPFITADIYHHIVKDYNIPEIVFSDNLRLIPSHIWKDIPEKINNYHFLKSIRFESLEKIMSLSYISNFLPSQEALIDFCNIHDIYSYTDLNNKIQIDYFSLEETVFDQKSLREMSVEYNELLNLFKENMDHIITPSKGTIKNILTLSDYYRIHYFQSINENGDLTYYFSQEDAISFIDNHASYEEFIDFYNIETKQLKYLVKYFNLQSIRITTSFYVLQIDPAMKALESDIAKIYLKRPHKYIRKSECAKRLGLHIGQMTTLAEEEGLFKIDIFETSYFLKHDVINLRGLREEIKKKYCRLSDYIRSDTSDFQKIESRRDAIGMERYSFGNKATFMIAERENVEEFFLLKEKEKQFKIQLDSVNYDNPWEAFITLGRIYKIGIDKLDKHKTLGHWKSFVHDRLTHTNKSPIILRTYVNSFVTSTEDLITFLGNTELSNRKGKEINFSLLNKEKNKTVLYELYLFVRSYYYTHLDTDTVLKFNFKNIFNPYNLKKEVKKQKYEDFDYKTFQYIYSYANTLNHLQPAIIDFENMLNDPENYKPKNIGYSWLYILIHLNNAWRHQDVCSIEMIDLDFLEINSFRELKSKKLSKEQIDRIIGLVLSKDYTIAKTNVTTRLYISEDIKTSVAYAYTLCYFFNKEKYPFTDKIINFNNKYNLYSTYSNTSFFTTNKLVFKNRKMNRTLLTLMYSMVQKNNPEIRALDIAKRLRSHLSIESTKQYIHIPDNDFNQLSEDIFNKGIFGYIPDMMNKIISNNASSLYQPSGALNKIKRVFHDIYNIEASSEFLNHITNQKQKIIDEFIQKKPEEVFEQLNNLKLNLLPAKEKNFQCLANNGQCIYPGKDCADCVLSVPNFYAVSNIVDKITSNIKLIDEHFHLLKQTEKVKYANLTINLLETLHYSIDKFGEKNVLQFFENEKKGYYLLLDTLDNISEEDNILDISTYNLEESDYDF